MTTIANTTTTTTTTTTETAKREPTIFDEKNKTTYCQACAGVRFGLSMLSAAMTKGVTVGYMHGRPTEGVLIATATPRALRCIACRKPLVAGVV